MNKRLLILTLLFTAFLLPLTIAGPGVTVISPNGGELLSGVFDIEFRVTNTASVTDYDINLYYSTSAGQFVNGNAIIEDLNLLTTCDYDTGTKWFVKNDKVTGLGTDVNQNTGIVEYDSDLYLFYKSRASPYSYGAYIWNTTTEQWDKNSLLITGLPSDAGAAPRPAGVHEWFELDGNLYVILNWNSAGASYQNRGYVWHPDAETWILSTAISTGLPSITDNYKPQYDFIENFQSKDWIIYSTVRSGNYPARVVSSYWWDSTDETWRSDPYLVGTSDGLYNEFDPSTVGDRRIIVSSDLFLKDEILSALIGYAEDTGCDYESCDAYEYIGLEFSTATASWAANSDLNKGISYTVGTNRWVEYTDSSLLGGAKYLFYFEQVPNTVHTSDNYNYVWDTALDTTETKTCTYSWDTTTANNGVYYLDAKVEDSTGATATDSSASLFTITNWTTADINCICVSNCETCTLDANGFVAVPEENLDDVVVKIQNSTGPKNFKMAVVNPNNSGKQYKIHIADESEYTSGIWNYSDTLTFGTTNYDPVQKIWDANINKYEYSFAGYVTSNQTIYYKFEYFQPAYHWRTVNQVPWDNELTPSTTDYNNLLTDIFTTSFYSNIGSTLTEPKFPSITDNVSESTNYVFQFTMKADSSATGELRAGTIPSLPSSDAPGTSLDLSTNYRTLSLTDISDGYIKFDTVSTTSRVMEFQNYVVVERGFFTKALEILEKDGSELPVYIEDTTAGSEKVTRYITEGSNFRVKSQYFDANGVIDRIEISAYIDKVDDANRLKKWVLDAEKTGLVDIDEELDGLIDLTASADNRDVLIAIRLVDTNANYYEIQSDAIKLIQFPYFSGDFQIGATITNKQVGKHPKGTISIRTKNPEALRGVRLYIYELGLGVAPGSEDIGDYNTSFYKDIDFECAGFDCSFDYYIEDFVFHSEGKWVLTASALLTTEAADYNSMTTSKRIFFTVYWKEFDTARVLETFERNADHTYRNDEEISLTLQLRDADWANMKNDVDVWMTISDCNEDATGGTCFQQDFNYRPDQYLYDISTGYNYYFWRQIFVEDTGLALEDGNYYRFMATVEDKQSTHGEGDSSTIYPLLTQKCQDYDTDCTDDEDILATTVCFIGNELARLNHFVTSSCTTPSATIVTTDTNSEFENRLLIDDDKFLPIPTHECHFCINADNNNIYVDQLKQDLLCGSWYTFNEAPIDGFRFYLTNEYSDFSKDREDSQYIYFDIPFSQIAFNDLRLMKDALSQEYGTTIDTIGELIQAGINELLVSFANPVVDNVEGLSTVGILTDMGVDCNFDNPFDPTYIGGMIIYKINGVDVINQTDLIQTYPELDGVNPADLIEYMNYEGIPIPESQTTVEYYLGDFKKIQKTVTSRIVINEPYSDTSVRKENIDESVDYETLPSRLRFTSIADLSYNGERNIIRRFVPLTITAIIKPDGGNIGNQLIQFIFENIYLLLMLLGFIFVVAIIYSKFRGTQTVINRGE